MNSKILTTIANAIDNKEDLKTRTDNGKKLLEDLIHCVQNCQNRFGGKSELATEDDLRILQLCDKWEKVLSHGIKTNLSNSAIQSLVTAGLNFTFNIVNVGHSLWSYTCLHLTKHEQERFKILSNINTPLGYFRAFLRASLNERSLERYLHSWVLHGLLVEYYEEGSLLKNSEACSMLPNLAAGLSSVLFALSIDRAELNESQQNNQQKAEHVIPLPTPIKPNSNTKRKPIRQVISFDINENQQEAIKLPKKSPTLVGNVEQSQWKSAPPTCLSSPDAAIAQPTSSEPSSTEYKNSIRQFFPETMKAIENPSQIFNKLSERAKEIFSSSHSIDTSVIKDDISDRSVHKLKISESDSEEVAGSIDGSTSCLELCFTEDEATPDEKALQTVLERREKDYLSLQMKFNQIEISHRDKTQKLERVVLDLSKENERLKEQLRQYMSALEISKTLNSNSNDSNNEEVSQYERKLIQVAEMHAELMEFNQHLQKRIQDLEGVNSVELLDCPASNVKAYIPTAFLVGKKTRSYHVYQVFVKVGQEEWNVYHRYAKFYELHTQLKKCHSDIANYKFPPKKAIGKRDAHLVEHRRVALQAYLRHILLVLPELRGCTSRVQLVVALPFFGVSSNKDSSGDRTLLASQSSIDSMSAYAAL